MSDTEKVIKGLDCCAKWMDEGDCEACDSCPYHPEYSDFDHNCVGKVNNDAIVIIKKQQELIDEMTKRRMNNGAFD